MKSWWTALLGVLALVAIYLLCFAPPIEGGTAEQQNAASERSSASPKPEETAQTDGKPKSEDVRKGIARPAARTEPTDPEQPSQEPVRVDWFTIRIHAVDKAGKSVPEAQIQVFQARRVNPSRGRGNVYSGPLEGTEPVWRGKTDATARRQIELDVEMSYLVVSKKGVGTTGYLPIWHSRTREGEWMVSLEPEFLLEGQVLRADGTPAAGVKVWITVQGGSSARRSHARRPPTLKTDMDGRFTEKLEPGTIYAVRAYDGDAQAHPVSVYTTRPGPRVRRVLVHFPGAIAIHGYLLDPRGNGVQGRVRVYEKMSLEEIRQRSDSPYERYTKTAPDGSFRLDLPRLAKYQLLGSADGHAASNLTFAEVTRARPHAHVQVQLLEHARIAGAVRGADGKPVSGASVYLRPESGQHPSLAGVPHARELFGRFQPVTTDAEGAFHFDEVHPGTSYTVVCWPDAKRRQLQVTRKEAAPGTTDIVIVVRPKDLRTAKIVVIVRSASTGQLIKSFQIRHVHYDTDGKIIGTSGTWRDVLDDGGRYVLTDLAMNRRYGIVVKAVGFAPRMVGPIDTSNSEHKVVLRLPDPGSLLARVRDRAGKPAVNVRVAIRPLAHIPGTGWRSSRPSDARGRCLFKNLTPGKYEVFSRRDGKLSERITLEVLPGQQAEVTLGLPR